jgi:ADP-heptose:LPS heptosyltransferase
MKIIKWFEHFVKNAVSQLLKAGLKQKPRIPKPPYRRILFLRYDALGDMILSFPIYRATRAAFPDSKIDVLCSPKNVTLLEGSSLANTLLVAGKNPLDLIKLIVHIRRENYDLVVNLVTRPSFTFGILARLGGSKSVRIAGDQEQFSYFYNRIIDLPPKRDIHMMKRKFLLCKDFLDPEISHIDKPWVTYDKKIKNQAQILFRHVLTHLNITGQKPRLAGLNLTAGLKRREWPLEKNEMFLQRCIEKYKDQIDGWIVFTDPEKPEKAGELVNKLIYLNRTNTGEISNPILPSIPVAHSPYNA